LPVSVNFPGRRGTRIISIAAGNNQSTPVNQAFAAALQVRVKDAAGNGVSGVAVTFKVTPGSNGASGTLEPRARVPAGCSLSAARRKGAALLRAA
jgi:hypothetical protein